jgi:hypothetical protein
VKSKLTALYPERGKEALAPHLKNALHGSHGYAKKRCDLLSSLGLDIEEREDDAFFLWQG